MGRARRGAVGLAAASETLAAWRQDFGGKGRAIPDGLWKMAIDVARAEGVAATARALKLDPRRLGARMPMGSVPAAESPCAFVEVPALSAAGSKSVTVVEFNRGDGDRVRVEMPSSILGSTEIVEMAGAFWSRGA